MFSLVHRRSSGRRLGGVVSSPSEPWRLRPDHIQMRALEHLTGSSKYQILEVCYTRDAIDHELDLPDALRSGDLPHLPSNGTVDSESH